jgi:hypothetical protein
MKEKELYKPMMDWLKSYLKDKYPKTEVITADTSAERLDRALKRLGVDCDVAAGIDIQVDIVGIVIQAKGCKLFFIEAKRTSLTLKDLGQLWAYCKLINPEEAFLLTSADLGALNKLINIYKREDLLDFGDGRIIKKMKIGIWNTVTGTPDMESVIPKI